MNIIRNRLSGFCGVLTCFTVLLSLSCGNNTATGQSISNNKTIENVQIIETVKTFWKLSFNGDKEKLPNYIKEAPKEFWEYCPSASNLDSNKNSNEVDSDETFPRGVGVGISITEREDTFWSLKEFSQQIKEKNVELVNTRVIRANANEAVVKIDWRQFNSGEGWVSHYMLLYKENTGWKIFMMTDPLTLTEYNKSFGYEEKCK